MSSTSETGHAKIVANYQDLIEFVTGYGAIYNPSKNNLKLLQIIIQKKAGETMLTQIITKNTAYNTDVNSRLAAFSNIRTLSTRLVAALQAIDASEQTIADAKGFNKKIQGKRSKTPETPLDPNQPAPKTISASQQSYDQLIQHFTGLKLVLETEATYTPNEIDLQIANLNAKIEDLTLKNSAVAKTYAALSNARIERNKILYTNADSIFETAKDIKRYIKSLFGSSSPEYNQVKGIQFKKPPLK